MNDIPFVTNIQRYCTDDGPGIRTTVFLKGCPLRCKWCHNPETHSVRREILQRNDKCFLCGKCVAICPAGARKINENGAEIDREKCTVCGKCADICPAGAAEICGTPMSIEEIIDVVLKDKAYYDKSGGGMTVSGGECSLFPEFTAELVRRAKEKGISSAAETCGCGDSSFYARFADEGVIFLYDLKEMNSEKHRELCGYDNKRILDNLSLLFEKKAKVYIRMPLIPGVNDSEEELKALYAFLKANEGRFIKSQVMPYHAMGNSKVAALSKTVFEVDKALSQNKCSACYDRWKNGLKEFFEI